MLGNGEVPVADSGRARAEEHRWGVRKLVAGSVWEEEGRRGRLHGAGLAAMAAGGAQACRGELDSARGWEGSGEEGRERVLREQKEKDKGEGAGRPTRHVVTVSLRADILSVRAWRRRRVARPRNIGEKPEAGKAVLAGGSARGRPGGRAGGETAMNGVSRRGREMEMVVMAVL